ncbi:hypothetical protein BOTBODRAFT_46980 [Botryobasidium botryosum FD-172 SS1]|uniref:Uncharacterized protein n=1 Tax=Botryobasidium botryosum (strain FD-172 SS1) TaxID=930990 RepID=A0A067MF06_BOTB1|nr:hypothetical protein BOTBODRAFT_46980 [Botryobasidium botryosum FD-172 SS1]
MEIIQLGWAFGGANWLESKLSYCSIHTYFHNMAPIRNTCTAAKSYAAAAASALVPASAHTPATPISTNDPAVRIPVDAATVPAPTHAPATPIATNVAVAVAPARSARVTRSRANQTATIAAVTLAPAPKSRKGKSRATQPSIATPPPTAPAPTLLRSPSAAAVPPPASAPAPPHSPLTIIIPPTTAHAQATPAVDADESSLALPVKRVSKPTQPIIQAQAEASKKISRQESLRRAREQREEARAAGEGYPPPEWQMQARLQAVMACVASLEEELANAQEAQKKAQERGDNYKKILCKEHADTQAPSAPKPIPHPSGGIRIQSDMLLSENPTLYRKIYALQKDVVSCMNQGGVDYEKYWTQQSKTIQSKVIKAARARHPYLGRFVGDWATQAIATQVLGNHVGYAKRSADPDSNYNRKRRGKLARRRTSTVIQPWMASTSAITQDQDQDCISTIAGDSDDEMMGEEVGDQMNVEAEDGDLDKGDQIDKDDASSTME